MHEESNPNSGGLDRVVDRLLFDEHGRPSIAGAFIFLLALIGLIGILGTLVYILGHGV